MSEPQLGVAASVYCDRNDSAPRTLLDEERAEVRDVVAHYFEDFDVVSIYSFQVALWALQNPTPANIAKALRVIAISGDCEEWVDEDVDDGGDFVIQPVPEPGWPMWERTNA